MYVLSLFTQSFLPHLVGDSFCIEIFQGSCLPLIAGRSFLVNLSFLPSRGGLSFLTQSVVCPLPSRSSRSCLPVEGLPSQSTQHIHNTIVTNKHASSGNVWYNCLKSKSIHSSRPIYTLPIPIPIISPLVPSRHVYIPPAFYLS